MDFGEQECYLGWSGRAEEVAVQQSRDQGEVSETLAFGVKLEGDTTKRNKTMVLTVLDKNRISNSAEPY